MNFLFNKTLLSPKKIYACDLGMKYLLDLVLWEDLLHSFRGERIQDYFNKEMLDCDIVFALFHTKVGQFTKEDLWLRMLSFIYSMSDHHEKGKEYHEEVLIP